MFVTVFFSLTIALIALMLYIHFKPKYKDSKALDNIVLGLTLCIIVAGFAVMMTTDLPLRCA